MNSKRLNILLIIILAANIAFTANMYFKNARVIETLSARKKKEKSGLQYEMLAELLAGNIKMHYANENRQLPDCQVTDILGNSSKLSSLFGSDHKLVFKYSTKNCSSCIEAELGNVTKIAGKIGHDRCIILTEGKGLRQAAAFVKERDLKIPVYMIPEGEIDILQKENMPFVCVMNKDLRTELLFIPMKELQGFSEQYYYSSVIPRFFPKKKP